MTSDLDIFVFFSPVLDHVIAAIFTSLVIPCEANKLQNITILRIVLESLGKTVVVHLVLSGRDSIFILDIEAGALCKLVILNGDAESIMSTAGQYFKSFTVSLIFVDAGGIIHCYVLHRSCPAKFLKPLK